MMKIDNRFLLPFAGPFVALGLIRAQGMSLRDWFAGQALAGMCADPTLAGEPDKWATQSYRLADAMIAARKGGAA